MLYIIINIIASYFPIQNILSNAPIEFDVVLVQSNYSNKLCNIAREHWSFILVGGFKPSEKYDFVSWDYDIIFNG